MTTDEAYGRLDERIKHVADNVDKVLVQTIATNGRVTELEGWRNRLKGAWATLVILGAMLGAVIGYVVAYHKLFI